MRGIAHGMVVSREEISARADLRCKEGIFEEREMCIITKLIALSNILVRDVMTPQTFVVAANSTLTLKEIYD